MTPRRLFASALFLWPCALAGGCSLVNSFGDVVEGTDGAGAADSSTDTTTDQSSGLTESGTETGPSVDGPSIDTGSADAPGDGFVHDGGTGDSSDGALPAQAGAVVVGGNQMGDGGFVLSVLDPTSGQELSRQPMTVVAMRYDGLRDLWYIFENNGGVGGIFPAPTDPVTLHVFTLQTSNGMWMQQATLAVPAIVASDTLAALNGRLAYTAYAVDDAGPTGGFELVLVDTQTPTNPQLINPPTALTDLPIGTIGTRNLSGPGGTINLFHVDQTMCEGDGSAELCELEAVHVTVQASGVPVVQASPIAVNAVNPQGSQGFGSYLSGGPEDTIAFPPANGSAAYVERFSTSTCTPIAGSTVTFGIANPHLQNIAISECYGMAFVVGVPTDTQVYGVPLGSGTGAVSPVDLGHAGQAVNFEPYTSSVIAPFKANGSFAIDAYRLSGTASAPSLSNRTTDGTWSPPTDLEPNFVEVRQPILSMPPCSP